MKVIDQTRVIECSQTPAVRSTQMNFGTCEYRCELFLEYDGRAKFLVIGSIQVHVQMYLSQNLLKKTVEGS